MYEIFMYFFIYAFLGWAVEVSYATLDTGKFINRGFLNGPVCPIYGAGCILIIWALKPIQDNLLYLFIGSVFLASLLEFITGALLEKIFHTKWWDYSNEPFNLKGYISLKFSIAWGIICVFVIKLIHPLIVAAVHILPNAIGNMLLLSFIIIILIDLSFTIRTILKMQLIFAETEEIVKRIRLVSDSVGGKISDEVLELQDKYKELTEKAISGKARLVKAFPNLKAKIDFPDIKGILEKIKGMVDNSIDLRK